MAAANKLNDRLNEAIAHHNAGRFDRAEAIYRQLATLAPRTAQIFHLWGQLAEQQNRFEDATRLYTRALSIAPDGVSTAVRLANVLIATGRIADAEMTLRRVLQHAPQSPRAWNTLGFVAKLRGRLADAIACHRKAVELDPKFADGWCQLGLTLGTASKNYRALECFDRALTLDPQWALARYGRAQALHKTYRTAEAIREYNAFLQLQPQHFEARSFRLFALQNLEDVSREQLFAEHRAYGDAIGAVATERRDHDYSPNKRLRVAVLSPDLRTHSCAYFLEPLLRHLDREQLELVLYHDHFVEDAMTARLRALASVWRNFVGQPNASVERTIRADRPDMLIDLNGHVANTIRLPLFARRLAPAQITYLGYPDTTGVPNMDFRLTDGIADPQGEADRYATEKLVRFAPTAWCYQPPADAPHVSPPPSIAAGTVTFGCFNSPTKFTDALFATWAELLSAVPNSRLLLKGRDFDEVEVRIHLLNRLLVAGVPLDRVELLPRTQTTAEHLAHYARVDVALDTFPYNGTTTTCEALWMGRPVVTLAGDRHASRVGASLLTAIGRREWIASTRSRYVEIARMLATESAGLVRCSEQLRDCMQCSALLDAAAQSARFAAALRNCWLDKIAAIRGDATTATDARTGGPVACDESPQVAA